MIQLEQPVEAGTATQVHIIAYRRQQRCATYEMVHGESVIIGTAKSCGLRLDGQGISSMHCLISFHGGVMILQEWPSSGGTLLNDKPISGEAEIGEGDKLCIGDCLLVIEALPLVSRVCPQEQVEEPVDDNIRNEPVIEHEERLAPLIDDSNESRFVAADYAVQETVELLRAEVQELQSELAERDSVLSEFMNANEPPGLSFVDEAGDVGDNAAVTARLDELLDELTKSDERAALLEDMLQASEDATYAEQEERRQLEAWVGDIEKRIIAREAEAASECETLKGRLAQVQGERDQVEQRLQQSASSDDARAEYESVLSRLRLQNSQLTNELERTTAERAAIQQRLESADVQRAAETQQAVIDEALREERAAIAQERATMARMRSELTDKLSDMEQQLKRSEDSEGTVDSRIREFRRHLKEIHEQEQRQRDRGLMSRIAGLWKRVDS